MRGARFTSKKTTGNKTYSTYNGPPLQLEVRMAPPKRKNKGGGGSTTKKRKQQGTIREIADQSDLITCPFQDCEETFQSQGALNQHISKRSNHDRAELAAIGRRRMEAEAAAASSSGSRLPDLMVLDASGQDTRYEFTDDYEIIEEPVPAGIKYLYENMVLEEPSAAPPSKESEPHSEEDDEEDMGEETVIIEDIPDLVADGASDDEDDGPPALVRKPLAPRNAPSSDAIEPTTIVVDNYTAKIHLDASRVGLGEHAGMHNLAVDPYAPFASRYVSKCAQFLLFSAS